MAVYWILLYWCECSVESDDCSPGRARLGGARAEPGSGDPSLDPRRLDPCLQPCRGRCRGLDRLRGALQITSAGLATDACCRAPMVARPARAGPAQPRQVRDPVTAFGRPGHGVWETRSRRLGDPVTAFGRPGHGVWETRSRRLGGPVGADPVRTEPGGPADDIVRFGGVSCIRVVRSGGPADRCGPAKPGTAFPSPNLVPSPPASAAGGPHRISCGRRRRRRCAASLAMVGDRVRIDDAEALRFRISMRCDFWAGFESWRRPGRDASDTIPLPPYLSPIFQPQPRRDATPIRVGGYQAGPAAAVTQTADQRAGPGLG